MTTKKRITKEDFMQEAIRQAKKAEAADEVPIGAVIVQNGKILSRGWNQRETKQQPSSHAEMEAIRKAASKIGSWRLEDCDLYVTLEPCPMCAGAIIQSRIRSVYFGAYDPKGGSVETCARLFEVPQYNHHPQWQGGILEEECAGLLKEFFKKKRNLKKQKKKELKSENQKTSVPCSAESDPSDSDPNS